MLKKILFKAAVLSAILIFVFCSALNAYAATPDYKTVRLIVDGTSQSVLTKSKTVGDFLEERGVTLYAKDKINYELDRPLPASRSVEIVRAFDLIITLDGEPIQVRIAPDTKIGSLLAELKEEYGGTYSHDYSISDIITPESQLAFYSISEKEFVEREIIDYDTEIILSDEYFVGTVAVLQEGETGVREYTYTATFRFIEEIGRVLTKVEVTKEPVKRIERHGINFLTDEDLMANMIPPREYLQKLPMTATAYSLDYNSTGKLPGDPGYGITKSGMQAAYGIVAVDPTIIPLGSKLFIEGYGIAIAGDIGSAIKGYRVDLFYEDVNDALRFGRQQLNVYVLEYPPEEPEEPIEAEEEKSAP